VPNENYYQGIASDLSNQGRYGDTMLMHVNPAEVQGLAAAFPGNVTRNPQTGLPEGFGILASLALGALIGGVTNVATKSETPLWQSILMGAAGSALTGGLMSGLGALGGTAGTTAALTAKETAALAVTEAAKESAVQGGVQGVQSATTNLAAQIANPAGAAGNVAQQSVVDMLGGNVIDAGGLTSAANVPYAVGPEGLPFGQMGPFAEVAPVPDFSATVPTAGSGVLSNTPANIPLSQVEADAISQLATNNAVDPVTNIFGEPGTNIEMLTSYLGSPSSVGAFALPQMYEEEEEEDDVRATEYPVYWNA